MADQFRNADQAYYGLPVLFPPTHDARTDPRHSSSPSRPSRPTSSRRASRGRALTREWRARCDPSISADAATLSYNDRVNSEGKPDSDEDRRDLVDDVVGTIADRVSVPPACQAELTRLQEIDTKNLDWLDRDAVVNVAVENVYRATS